MKSPSALRNIYHQRCTNKHKLNEWSKFGDWVEMLRHGKELITYGIERVVEI